METSDLEKKFKTKERNKEIIKSIAEGTKNYKEYPFLSLCARVSVNYYDLPIGTYVNGKYSISVVDAKDFLMPKNPSRVHMKTGVVEVRKGLEESTITLLFFLLWGFVSFENRNETDLEIDIRTIDIINKITNNDYDRKGFCERYMKLMGDNLSKDNLDRINDFLKAMDNPLK